MRYSIITPTVLRDSLLDCCESVNKQTCTDWEHIVMVDTDISNDILVKIQHPQRIVLRCAVLHNNWGHTCRHIADQYAKGDYLYHLDDDNYLANDNVLEVLKQVTAPWAIFPILRYGEIFFNDPPGRLKTDTGSILIRRDLGPWPNLPNYDTDGIFIEQLLKDHPYQSLSSIEPLMIMPSSSISILPDTNGDRISIYTPVHDITYLREAYDSIKYQDFHEWIVVYNNGGVPIEFNDSRIKSHILYKAPEKVGPLKAYACERATGDILLELDCDDMLMPTAIEEVKKAFSDPEVGFVYSNTVRCTADLGKFPRFDELYGWRYREVEFNGRQLDEFIAFPPTPEAISRIWFAPDHLRAFRRSTYQRAGGYDKSMRVLDDSDLMCKMYLAAKTVHIDKGLYIYRVHGQNSWLKYNQEIQENVYRIYDLYINRLVSTWASRNNIPVIDVYKLEDMTSRQDSSIGAIVATDSFASMSDPLKIMKEVYRTLVPGGWLFCQVPSTDGRGAYQDPRHVSFWNENSFLYYTNQDWAKYIDTPVRFQPTRLYTTELNDNRVCWTVAHLISLKNGYRPPGLLTI